MFESSHGIYFSIGASGDDNDVEPILSIEGNPLALFRFAFEKLGR
jgi:hypothetical protein